jgi:hypothetical protein
VQWWILVAVVAGSLAVIAALALALRRARRMAAEGRRLAESARAELRQVVAEETASHKDEIRHTLARERAESVSVLAADERRMAEEHRAEFAERERQAGDALAHALAGEERRLEERLRGFTEDLERAQTHIEDQLRRFEQRSNDAIAAITARIEADASEIGSAADEQRRTVHRLREELGRVASQSVSEALDELEAQTLERRRALEEITERLRTRETAVAESIERAETDVRARLDILLVEWEKRQTDRLERVTEREIERHAQIASLAFDERMREIKETATTQLRRELDRAIEALSREELVQRLDAGQ